MTDTPHPSLVAPPHILAFDYERRVRDQYEFFEQQLRQMINLRVIVDSSADELARWYPDHDQAELVTEAHCALDELDLATGHDFEKYLEARREYHAFMDGYDPAYRARYAIPIPSYEVAAYTYGYWHEVDPETRGQYHGPYSITEKVAFELGREYARGTIRRREHIELVRTEAPGGSDGEHRPERPAD